MYSFDLLKIRLSKIKIPKFFKMVIVLLIIFVLLTIVVLTTPLKNQLMNISFFKDVVFKTNTAEWVKYDTLDTEPKFTLIVAKPSVPLWQSCSGAKYKCGDEGWKSLDVEMTEIKEIYINNRCLIETSSFNFCDIVLSDGSLISMNEKTKIQIVFENNKLKIIQSTGETLHYVKPNTDYSVEIGNNIILTKNAGFFVGYGKDGNKHKIQVVVSTGVANGSVNLSQKNSEKLTTILTGQYAIFDYNSSPCPDIFKQCGTSCIPMEATCCSDELGSFCDTYGICAENIDNKCSIKNIFRTEKSAFCCQYEGLTDTDIGSYTCDEGKVACGYACIDPTKEKCNVLGGSGAWSSDVYAVEVNSFADFSEIYNNNDFTISFDKVFGLVNENNFNGSNNTQIADLLLWKFLKEYTNYYASSSDGSQDSGSSSGGSDHSRCDDIPMTGIVYEWCIDDYTPPSSAESDFVYCAFTSNEVSNGGEGFFPPECVNVAIK